MDNSLQDPYLILKEINVLNRYIQETMLPENKIRTWKIHYRNSIGELVTIPIVGVGTVNNSLTSEYQKKAYEIGKRQFESNQCGLNCKRLFNVFGPEKYILCSYARLTTIYTTELSDIANRMKSYSISCPSRFTLKIATPKLLGQDNTVFNDSLKYNIDNSSLETLCYVGNCDTLEEKVIKDQRIHLLQRALTTYWEPVYNLLSTITEKWDKAGHRHATLRRITSIEAIIKSTSIAETYFKKTLTWIFNVVRKLTKPIMMYNLEDRVQIVISAIADGDIIEKDDKTDSVSLEEFQLMNDHILELMTSNHTTLEVKSAILKISNQQTDNISKNYSKFCSNCSAPRGRNALICGNCGARF